MRVRLLLGIAILVAQVGSVAYAHFGPAPHGQSWVRKTLDGCSAEPVGCRRYFAWAPNDYAVEYRLTVTVGGVKRSYEVIAPVKALPAKAPVIVFLAGISAATESGASATTLSCASLTMSASSLNGNKRWLCASASPL